LKRYSCTPADIGLLISVAKILPTVRWSVAPLIDEIAEYDGEVRLRLVHHRDKLRQLCARVAVAAIPAWFAVGVVRVGKNSDGNTVPGAPGA